MQALHPNHLQSQPVSTVALNETGGLTTLSAIETSVLLSLSESIATVQDHQQLCQIIVEQIQPLLGFVDAGVIIFGKDGQHHCRFLSPTVVDRSHALHGRVAEQLRSDGCILDSQVIEYLAVGADLIEWPVAELLQVFPQHPCLQILHEAGLHHVLALKLYSSGLLVGQLMLYFNAAPQIPPIQCYLYKAVANQVALAMTNILVSEQTIKRALEKELHRCVSKALTTINEWEEKLFAVSQAICKVMPWCICTISVPRKSSLNLNWIHKPETKNFERFSAKYVLSRWNIQPIELRDLMQREATQHHTAVICNGKDFAGLVAQQGYVWFLHEKCGIKSQLCLPIWVKGEMVALFRFSCRQANFYQPHHLHLMQRLAPQIALGLENVFAIEEIQQHAQERTRQFAINELLLNHKEGKSLYPTVARELNQMVGFSVLSAWIYDTDKEQVVSHGIYSRSGTDFNDITAQAEAIYPDLKQKAIHDLLRCPAAPVCYTGDAHDEWLANSLIQQQADEHRFSASKIMLPLPLQASGIRAVLSLDSHLPYAFTEKDVQALLIFVPLLALAVDNMLAYQEITQLKQQVEQEKIYQAEELQTESKFEEIVGSSPLLMRVFRQIKQVSPTEATVLILGESGTGKELVAHALHTQSPRRERALVKVNCAALPAQLIESELFGHEKGAFTGALERRIGKFELASGGTIFLDEIGEMPLELQAKLLRVLQEREIERLGGKGTIPVDIRVVAATNRDLEVEVAEGRFRADLYYRLHVFPIHMPALRERRDDIPALATHFARRFARQMGNLTTALKNGPWTNCSPTTGPAISANWPT